MTTKDLMYVVICPASPWDVAATMVTIPLSKISPGKKEKAPVTVLQISLETLGKCPFGDREGSCDCWLSGNGLRELVRWGFTQEKELRMCGNRPSTEEGKGQVLGTTNADQRSRSCCFLPMSIMTRLLLFACQLSRSQQGIPWLCHPASPGVCPKHNHRYPQAWIPSRD